jgi:hypothetical protein
VQTLSDEELARLASGADKAQADFAAGRLEDRDLLIIIVAILWQSAETGPLTEGTLEFP